MRLAKNEELASGLDAWIAKVEVKLDENHIRTLAAIGDIRDDLNRAKGAGWVLVKVGVALMAVLGLIASAVHIAGDLAARK